MRIIVGSEVAEKFLDWNGLIECALQRPPLCGADRKSNPGNIIMWLMMYVMSALPGFSYYISSLGVLIKQ